MLLTGVRDFRASAAPGGLLPVAPESEHDVLESSHASASLAWVDGTREKHRHGGTHVTSVIGDGALTGGLAWGGSQQHRGFEAPTHCRRRQ